MTVIENCEEAIEDEILDVLEAPDSRDDDLLIASAFQGEFDPSILIDPEVIEESPVILISDDFLYAYQLPLPSENDHNENDHNENDHNENDYNENDHNENDDFDQLLINHDYFLSDAANVEDFNEDEILFIDNAYDPPNLELYNVDHLPLEVEIEIDDNSYILLNEPITSPAPHSEEVMIIEDAE